MKNNKSPAISVVMGVYNAEKYIDQAIESILGQTYGDFELLLLNDGSTDNSQSRLEYYAKLDKRCKVYSGVNKGMVATLNQGIALAKADIIFRMDNDDICRPQRFERQMRYLEDHPECVAVGSKALLIDADGLPIIEMWDYTDHDKIDEANLSGVGSFICHPAVAMRKAAILKVGGYHQEFHYAEDLDIFLRLAEVGILANIPEVLLEYRQHVESVGYARREAQFKATHLSVIEAKKRRGLPYESHSVCEESLFIPPSPSEIHLKWAWWALAGNNRQTAKKHAFKAFLENPFNLEVFRVFYSLYFRKIFSRV